MGIKRPFRIMVIDDDQDILELLDYNLRKEGFAVTILSDGRDAVREADTFQPDLIILDIMMPYTSGFDICKTLRTSPRFPDIYIFFLTALSDHQTQREAYTTGADDYIEKIVGLRALTYKITTVLKNQYIIRKRQLSLRVGETLIERGSCTATRRGKTVQLSPSEFELLFFLAQNAGKTASHTTLIRNIWGSDTYLLDSSIENSISSIQKKLGRIVVEQGQKQYKFVG